MKLIIALDASQMTAFLKCEQQWALSYVENLQLYMGQRKFTSRGSLMHKFSEVFYTLRSLQPRADRYEHYNIVSDLFKSGKLVEKSGLSKEDEKYILDRFLQYVIFWTAYDFVPLRSNGKPAVEVGFSKVLYEDESKIFVVEGKIDLLTSLPDEEPCFVDHKTQDRLSYLYPFKPQFLTYSYATGFKRGMINYIRLADKIDPKTTFRRELFYIQQHQLDSWIRVMFGIFNRIYVVMSSFNLTSMDKIKADMFIQNLGSCSGSWESNPCAYCKICEDDGQRKDLIKQTYYTKRERWSPWA